MSSTPLDLDKLAQISHDIEDIVDWYDTDYVEGVLLYCEQNNIEIEAIAEFIKKNDAIKSKLEESAEELNYFKKQTRLPL